VLIDILEKDK